MSSTTAKGRKIIITQALPYANASLHLGHILEAVQSDIWSRFQNNSGNECLFFCADDTHGTPVMLKAKEMGISPEKLIKDVQKDHEETYKLYDINFTNYHSTHSEENKKYSELIYSKAKDNGFITRNTIKISNNVGISLIILKYLEDFELVLFFKATRHLPKYSLKKDNKIIATNLICIHNSAKTSIPFM